MKARDARNDAKLEVVVGSPHTAEEAEAARRQGLIPIERQGGPHDGKTIGWGRVRDAKTGKPLKASKILVGRKETILVPERRGDTESCSGVLASQPSPSGSLTFCLLSAC